MSKENKHFYEFGAFRIDTVNRLLLSNGEPVPLKAKAIDTLLLLIEHNGQVVEKDDLMHDLWPDSFVEEGNLTQNIYMLRKALGDGGYIETIPRRGYRFAADVKEWNESPSNLILIKEKTKTSLSYEEQFEHEPSESDRDMAQASQNVVDATAKRASLLSTNVKPASRSLSRILLWPALAVFAIVLVIAAMFVWRRGSRPPFETLKLARFTTTGNALRTASASWPSGASKPRPLDGRRRTCSA